MRLVRWKTSPILAFFSLTVLFGSPGVAFAAKPGFISGTVKTKPTTSRFAFPSIVRAVQVEPPFQVVSTIVPSNGKYRLPVNPGGHVVLVNAWQGDQSGYKSSRKFVFVKPGKTVKVGTAGASLVMPGWRSSAVNIPDGPVISVGSILMLNSSGQPFVRGDGRNLTFDDVLITDFTATSRSCSFHVGEDREHGRFGEVLKEIKLQSSRYFDKRYRKSLKASLRTLELWAPQYRLTGSISPGANDFEMTANLKIIDLRTGKVVWCRNISFSVDGLFSTFPANVATAVANSLCGATDIPASIQGTFSGEAQNEVLGFKETWSGSVTYLPADPDPLDGLPSFLGIGLLTVYQASNANISEWDVSGGNGQCIYRAHDSAMLTNPLSGSMFVEITPAECGERRYGFASIFEVSTPSTLTITCGGVDTQITRPWGVSLSSELNYPNMSQFTGNSATGSYGNPSIRWQWNMTVTPQ